MDGFAERFRGLLSLPVGNGREFFCPDSLNVENEMRSKENDAPSIGTFRKQIHTKRT